MASCSLPSRSPRLSANQPIRATTQPINFLPVSGTNFDLRFFIFPPLEFRFNNVPSQRETYADAVRAARRQAVFILLAIRSLKRVWIRGEERRREASRRRPGAVVHTPRIHARFSIQLAIVRRIRASSTRRGRVVVC